jgi:hypothetical protein
VPIVQLAGRKFWLGAGIAIGVGMSLRIRHNLHRAAERARASYRRASPTAQFERRRRELRTALDVGRREMVQREAELRAQFDPRSPT